MKEYVTLKAKTPKRTVYTIKVDYYCWDEEKEEVCLKPVYAGTMHPPVNVYVFDEEFNDRSLRWGKKDDAINYFMDHKFNEDACCYENARIVKVVIE